MKIYCRRKGAKRCKYIFGYCFSWSNYKYYVGSSTCKGKTVIENAAKEPEIVNVATFLNNMGAKIMGAGTSQIIITGVSKLNGCFHEVIPDRIEAGTYTIIGALVGKNLKIYNIIPEHIEALTSKLKEMGANIEIGPDYLVITKKMNTSRLM